VGTEVNDPSLGGEDGGAKADVIVVGAGVFSLVYFMVTLVYFM
jgi:hypothetical protein